MGRRSHKIKTKSHKRRRSHRRRTCKRGGIGPPPTLGEKFSGWRKGAFSDIKSGFGTLKAKTGEGFHSGIDAIKSGVQKTREAKDHAIFEYKKSQASGGRRRRHKTRRHRRKACKTRRHKRGGIGNPFSKRCRQFKEAGMDKENLKFQGCKLFN